MFTISRDRNPGSPIPSTKSRSLIFGVRILMDGILDNTEIKFIRN